MHADGAWAFHRSCATPLIIRRGLPIKQQIKLHAGRFEVIDALHPARVVQRASRDHPACFYLRVLRASPSFICGKILLLRRCHRMVTDMLTGLQCAGCGKRSQPWNQTRIIRSKPPRRTTSRRRRPSRNTAPPADPTAAPHKRWRPSAHTASPSCSKPCRQYPDAPTAYC